MSEFFSLYPTFIDKMGAIGILGLVTLYLGYLYNSSLKAINNVLIELKEITKEMIKSSDYTHQLISKDIKDLKDDVRDMHRALNDLTHQKRPRESFKEL